MTAFHSMIRAFSTSRLSRLLLPLLLFAIVFALFSPSRRFALVDLDDYAYVNQNRTVMQGLSAQSVREAFSLSNTSATMYMPLLWISYMADVSLWDATGNDPAPFHLVNVALHALSALFLFFLLRRLRATTPWAFLLALLWAVHPLRVESVAWVTERKDTLAAFFGLASTLLWFASAAPSRRPVSRVFWLVSASLVYALGLLAKPSLVPLPLAWLAFDFWPLRRIPGSLRAPGFLRKAAAAAAEKIPCALAAAVAAVLAVVQHHHVSGSLAVPWSVRLAAVAPNFLFYVRKTLLPVRLTPLVPEQWGFPLPHILVALFVCASLAAAVWSFRRTLPSLLPGAVWVLLFFLPASGLQPLPMNTVADRFSYLPAIGLSLALAALPGALPPVWRKPACSLLALLLLPLACMSARLLPIWQNTESLYSRVLACHPAHPVAAAALSELRLRRYGDFDGAARILEPALQAAPLSHFLRLANANILAESSPQAALDSLQGLPLPESSYDRGDFFFAVARLELALGNPDRAIEAASRAISLYPVSSTISSPPRFLLVAAALDKNDSGLALRFARQTRLYAQLPAAALDNALPYAIFQWLFGARKDALAWFERILEAFPDRTELWNNLVWGLATASWSPADPARVLELATLMRERSPFPDHPGILDTLAAAQANAGNFGDALQTIQKAIDQLPPTEDSFRTRLLNRQALFQTRQPYRENAFDRLFVVSFGEPVDSL